MTRIVLGSIAVLGSLVGCASLLESDDRVLLGAWGGADISIEGSARRVSIRLLCEAAAINRPLRLDLPAGDTAVGAVTSPGGNAGAPIRVIATFARDTASLAFQTFYNGKWGGNSVYRVVKEQPMTFTSHDCPS